MFYAISGDAIITYRRRADRDEAVEAGEARAVDGDTARRMMRRYLIRYCGFTSGEVSRMCSDDVAEVYESVMLG